MAVLDSGTAIFKRYASSERSKETVLGTDYLYLLGFGYNFLSRAIFFVNVHEIKKVLTFSKKRYIIYRITKTRKSINGIITYTSGGNGSLGGGNSA